jgi:hypothetical protein
LPHHDFLELLLADEAHRRDRQATARRARKAHLNPDMTLDAFDENTPAVFHRQL